MRPLTTRCYRLDVAVVRRTLDAGGNGARISWGPFDPEGEWITVRLSTHEDQPCLLWLWGDPWPGGGSPWHTIYYGEKPMASGGTRRAFFCPGCPRKARLLYLPRTLRWGPGALFGCRRCHGLAYPSQNKSEQQRDFAKVWAALELAMDPEAMDRATGQHLDQALRALQAFNAQEQPFRGSGRPRTGQRPPEPQPAAQPASRLPGRPRTKRPYHRRTPLVCSQPPADDRAYCTKCRDRRTVVDAEPVVFRNGRPAIRGHCSKCGTTMARIVKRTA